MKIKANVTLGAMLLLCLNSNAQTPSPGTKPAPKQIAAKRMSGSFKLDGLINDEAWITAPSALGYTEFRPTPFKTEDTANKTEVYMLYNDEGIYLGGYCHERTKDSISTELRGRDGFGNNDFIGFIFDTYNDKINGFEYFITPLGEQWDAKIAPPQPNSNNGGEDFSWNAVWKSAAVIHKDGWSFEMFLPFSAIRFSKEKIQDWGLNITRRRQKTGQQYTWNTIDPNVNGFLTQEGFWTGLENIKPPMRLQFTPYLSSYANHFPLNQSGKKNWTSSVSGGMDVKYGISQAITLDMTLIPDFGQVKSDNTILNLTPFEIKYEERRPFFLEGTELFSKGGLFYPRRVGGRPLHFNSVYNTIGANEIVIANPRETKLVNATKISGRLKGGLGVGFFNAVSSRTFATVEDDNKVQRKAETSPLTNYNIIVLDQTLKNNSSVSLVNTNVLRSGKDYDANVTAALFDFNDKSNTWNVGGKAGISNLLNYLPDGKNKSGFTGNIYFAKTSGRFNFNFSETITDDKYQINDLGYFTNNNYWAQSLWMGYNWTKPSKWYNRLNLNLNLEYTRRFTFPTKYQGASFNFNTNGQLKNLWHVGIFTGYEPSGNDYYEPHMEGRFFKGWKTFFSGGWVETNNAKKYQVSMELLFISRSLFAGKKYSINMNQRYRFNNKLSVMYGLSLEPQKRNVGFADFDGNDIIFGKRDISTVENSFTIRYNFNKKMGLNADIRHYWSKVVYGNPALSFYKLLPDGKLEHTTSYTGDANQNFNAFNID
ncbi:MAG TPA: DUF5916 domain-containing protein, partial [Chitinophagaceae bacterium]|nr:DUF5916 domain-containing protein [Chitinophagaceae bacterium]